MKNSSRSRKAIRQPHPRPLAQKYPTWLANRLVVGQLGSGSLARKNISKGAYCETERAFSKR